MAGTSGRITITGEVVKERKFHKVVSFTMEEAKPPLPAPGNMVSPAMTMWTIPWPEIAFEKITFPRWDGIGKYTGDITNKPDFIRDYHFISMMRLIDTYLYPQYIGVITATGQTPNPIPPNPNPHGN